MDNWLQYGALGVLAICLVLAARIIAPVVKGVVDELKSGREEREAMAKCHREERRELTQGYRDFVTGHALHQTEISHQQTQVLSGLKDAVDGLCQRVNGRSPS